MSQSDKPICVIEDNKAIRKLFCTLLKKSGFETVDFELADPAIEWLQGNTPHAMVIDILLPGKKSGTDVLAALRAMPEGNKVPAIAVTGFAQGNDREKFIEMGFDSYIAKPINTASFVNEIKQVIASKEQ
jgi:CheY-like chemotaxis protein